MNPQDLQAMRGHDQRTQALGPGCLALSAILALMLGVLTFVALFADMAIKGLGRIDYEFFASFPSRRAAQAGILVGLGRFVPGDAGDALLRPFQWVWRQGCISRNTRRRTG
jgi:hypothetical protein